MKITPEKEYDGILTLSGEHDPLRQGRYLVHIDELMFQSDPETHGIWCQNHVHKWRITPSKFGEYGQYFPLQPGTRVVVKFRTRQITSGYIDRIRSDMLQDTDVEAQDCVKPKENIKDRDEQYIIFKTPKKNNVFYINENTDNEPNTIFLIYNRDDSGRRTVLRINEGGIHIYTRDELNIRITGVVNIKADSDINIDGGKNINLNCGKANPVDLESTPGNTEAFNIGDNSNKLQNIESADTPDSFDG